MAGTASNARMAASRIDSLYETRHHRRRKGRLGLRIDLAPHRVADHRHRVALRRSDHGTAPNHKAQRGRSCERIGADSDCRERSRHQRRSDIDSTDQRDHFPSQRHCHQRPRRILAASTQGAAAGRRAIRPAKRVAGFRRAASRRRTEHRGCCRRALRRDHSRTESALPRRGGLRIELRSGVARYRRGADWDRARPQRPGGARGIGHRKLEGPQRNRALYRARGAGRFSRFAASHRRSREPAATRRDLPTSGRPDSCEREVADATIELLCAAGVLMVFFNYATMQMAAKIVYYGPGLCGKTTNLHYIYVKTSPQSRGEMVSLETETDRTLFFDLLPIDVGVIGGFKTRLQLYTIPGQVFYNTTRKLVLKGVDGIVFVADSQVAMQEANVESFQNLRENLKEIGLKLDEIPMVMQLNKRDLPNVAAVDDMLGRLDPDRKYERMEAIAATGVGVFETLKTISKLTLRTLRSRMTGEDIKGAPRVAAQVATFRVKEPPPSTTGTARAQTAGSVAVETAAEEVIAAPARQAFSDTTLAKTAEIDA